MIDLFYSCLSFSSIEQLEYKLFQISQQRNFNYKRKISWHINKETKVEFLDAIETFKTELKETYLVDNSNVIFIAIKYQEFITFLFCSNSFTNIENVIKKYKKIYPPETISDSRSVQFRFWYSSSACLKSELRKLETPTWKEIKENYSADTKEKLEKLMSCKNFDPADGKLILWHGTIGTGKTYAIRALANSWSKWCDINYIVDPEKFFSEGDYLISAILYEIVNSDEDADTSPKKWKLFIIEDMNNNFLSQDAETEQGFSRLLNLSEGLIGQGLNVIILITTSEEVVYHEAIIRPGRCFSNIEFKRFNSNEISSWLKKNNVKTETNEKFLTLAELYALKKGKNLIEEKTKVEKKIGF